MKMPIVSIRSGICIVLLLLLSVTHSFSQSSLLWKITGKDLTSPSYLYGTIHIKDDRVFQFGDTVKSAFYSCSIMAGELVLEKVDPAILREKALMPPGVKLKHLMSKPDYKLVKKYCRKNLGIFYLLINKIRPVFTASLIGETGSNKDHSVPLDLHLQNMAKEKGMKVVGIETLEEQLTALETITLKEQAEMLVAAVKSNNENKNETEQLIQLYLNQDLKGIEALTMEEGMSEEAEGGLIIDRNIVMANRIEQLIQQSSTFAAIGAAHLPGAKGVIQLLIEKGYIVEPVIFEFNKK